VNAIETIYQFIDPIPKADFDGVNDPVDPEMICLHTLGEALEERVRYYVANSPEIAREFASAYLDTINWVELADRKIEDWTNE
jgi:hypothetical protein